MTSPSRTVAPIAATMDGRTWHAYAWDPVGPFDWNGALTGPEVIYPDDPDDLVLPEPDDVELDFVGADDADDEPTVDDGRTL